MPLSGTEDPSRAENADLSGPFDCCVVGAGICGAPLAATLAKQGRRVLLIERDMKEPDRIVGELMQPGGCDALRHLGLEWCLEDIDAAECVGYAVILDDKNVILNYPPPNNVEDAAPNEGVVVAGVKGKSFHHGRFIMQLRKAAVQEKNVTVFEATANNLLFEDGKVVGVSCTPSGSDKTVEVRAPITFVADGCFSKFRRDFVDRTIQVPGHFVGLVLEHADLPHPGFGHVVLANPSPILLYQISSTETRILVDVPGPKLPSASNGDLEKYMREFVMPQLPKPVQPSFARALEKDRLRAMPNQFLPPTANTQEGMVLLGDAMNMRHPLTGGGMTVGLSDVVLITDALKGVDLKDTVLVLKKVKATHWKRKNLAGVVNVLSLALYRLFSAGDDKNMAALRNACFAYFELGGRAVSDPIKLLGCVLPSPVTLFYHFFAVAFYAMWHICTSGRLIDLPINSIRAMIVLVSAAKVIFPLIGTELENRPMTKADEVSRQRDARKAKIIRFASISTAVALSVAVGRYVLKRR